MSKFTIEQKTELYNKKKDGYTYSYLTHEFGINACVRYPIHLIDKHGVSILRKDSNKYYSPEFKEVTIKRVLIDGESNIHVSINLGLTSKGMLSNWIKSYIENCYNVVEKKMTVKELKIKNKELFNRYLVKETVGIIHQ